MQWGRRKKQEEKKKSANRSTQQIDCKFCGRKHVPDRSKSPAYDQHCNKCGKSNHLLRSAQEEGSSVVINLPRRFRWESI